jgi:hypothetical protein
MKASLRSLDSFDDDEDSFDEDEWRDLQLSEHADERAKRRTDGKWVKGPMSAIHREKIRAAMKGRGKGVPKTEAHKRKIARSMQVRDDGSWLRLRSCVAEKPPGVPTVRRPAALLRCSTMATVRAPLARERGRAADNVWVGTPLRCRVSQRSLATVEHREKIAVANKGQRKTCRVCGELVCARRGRVVHCRRGRCVGHAIHSKGPLYAAAQPRYPPRRSSALSAVELTHERSPWGGG